MNQYSYGQSQPMYNPQIQNAYGINAPYVSGINWVQGVEGATASGYVAEAAAPITLPIATTIRKGCNCDGASQIVLKLIEGPGDVTNVSTRIVKS